MIKICTYWLICLIVAMMAVPLKQARAETGTPPPYQLNRADENYLYLLDPAQRTDLWDPLKYIPLNETGSWYLSIGGDARERYEYFNHHNWGKDPQDHGYFLQRYFLHGDLHMGKHVRLFSQFQTSLEDGRKGGGAANR